MAALNYNHLRYFWAVAREGNLTRTAAKLLVSQSALSIQIKKLEIQLGHDLFERTGRQLLLTEAGRIAPNNAVRSCAWVLWPRSRATSRSASCVRCWRAMTSK
jgi:hypothetical protein